MDFGGKSVLITGGGGNLGSHIIDRLVTLGAEITIMEKKSHDTTKFDNIKQHADKISLAWGDIRNTRDCHQVLQGKDVVIHAAAQGPVPYSIDYPLEVWDTNVNGTINMLEAARKYDVERFVYINSSESYGRAKETPINEEHGFYPCSPYGASKATGELMVQSYFESYGLKFATVRLVNLYGPRAVGYSVIPKFILLALENKQLPIAGSGAQKRDYVFTPDAAEGIVKAAECDALVGDCVNIGSGKAVSVVEIAETVKRITGSKSELKFMEARPGELPILLCDNSKAKRVLNWVPKHSFEDGMRKTVEYYKANKKFYSTEKVSKSL